MLLAHDIPEKDLRWFRNKGILVRRMPGEKLVIVGSYEKSVHFQQYRKYIEELKPENVILLDWVNQEKLIELYANCKGFITTAKNEDFGLTPVEAMASGKPVICGNEGGYRETVIDGVTGVLIDNINEEKLINAVSEVGPNAEDYKRECLRQAKKFDTRIFIKKIKGVTEG